MRLVARPKNVKPTLDALAADGFTRFAFVSADTTSGSLDLRDSSTSTRATRPQLAAMLDR